MNYCPTCGKPGFNPDTLPEILTADALVAMMHIVGGDANTRDVYESQNGYYFLTYGKGQRVSRAAINEAVSRGMIESSYPDIPDGSWSLPAKAAENRQKIAAWEAKHGRRFAING